MSDQAYAVPAEWAAHAKVDARRYDALYRASIDESDAFWLDQARRLDWLSFPTKADESSFHKESFGIRWFADGHLNVATNCLDRHLASRGNAPAIIWEPDDPTEASRTITYLELYEQVCRLANVLKAHGVTKGDRVTISMPMIFSPVRGSARSIRSCSAGFRRRRWRAGSRIADRKSSLRPMRAGAAVSRCRLRRMSMRPASTRPW
jgi:hypothetical protein